MAKEAYCFCSLFLKTSPIGFLYYFVLRSCSSWKAATPLVSREDGWRFLGADQNDRGLWGLERECSTRYPLWTGDCPWFLICSGLTIIVDLGHCELDRDYGKWRFFRKRSSDSLDIGLEPGITRWLIASPNHLTNTPLTAKSISFFNTM